MFFEFGFYSFLDFLCCVLIFYMKRKKIFYSFFFFCLGFYEYKGYRILEGKVIVVFNLIKSLDGIYFNCNMLIEDSKKRKKN